MTEALVPFDSKQLRQVLSTFVTGVTVVTTIDKRGKKHGLTVNSFSSVSLDPPLVLWSQSLNAPSYPIFAEAEFFAINILSQDQVPVSNCFARGGDDKFSDIGCRRGIGGVPLIEGCSAYLECKRVASYPGGDHALYIGLVQQVGKNDSPPLIFGNGRYMNLGQLEIAH